MNQPDLPLLLFDFSDPSAVAQWTSIDDRVMGGISRSYLRHDAAGHAVFEGVVSLERNGGFASVRSTPGARGKPGAEACLIEVRASGQRFKLSLLTEVGFDSLNYQTPFEPATGAWQTLHLPLAPDASFAVRPLAIQPRCWLSGREFTRTTVAGRRLPSPSNRRIVRPAAD